MRTFNSISDRGLVTLTIPSTGTLAMHITPTGWSSGTSNRAFFDLTTNSANFFRIQQFTDGNYYCGWVTSTTDYRATAASAGLADGTRSKLILTWDDAANETRFYIDSTQRASNTSALVTHTATGIGVIGNTTSGVSDIDLSADIGEFVISNNVWSSTQRSDYIADKSPELFLTKSQILVYFRWDSNAVGTAMILEQNITSATHPTIQYLGDVPTMKRIIRPMRKKFGIRRRLLS